MSAIETLSHLIVGSGDDEREIAVRTRPGNNPGLVWLGGYRSDMLGTKAEALADFASSNGIAMCRHDYSGHGESGGEFNLGTISRWTQESLEVFDAHTEGPQILIGSSMGAWVALRMVQELRALGNSHRIAGLLLLAPAPDFTHELMLPALSPGQKAQIDEQGFLEEHSEYSEEPNIFTKALFEDGKENLVMTAPIETGCPVHVLQGMNDPDVPYEHAMKLVSFLPHDQVTVTLVKDGDHRLSRDQDIALLLRIVESMTEKL